MAENSDAFNSLPSEKKQDLIFYKSLINSTLDQFVYLNRRFVSIPIIDLRGVGVLLLIVSIVAKFITAFHSANQIFSSSEFITTISVGTALLILGSYFEVKKMQENRKAIEETSKTFIGKLQAGSWTSSKETEEQVPSSNL